MSNWLAQIAEEINMVTDDQIDLAEPECKPCEQDHVVGMLSRESRRLYTLMRLYTRKFNILLAEIDMAPPEERGSMMAEAKRLKASADALAPMFWATCHHEYPELYAKDSVGVRKGWRVVWSEEHCIEISGAELLGALFGHARPPSGSTGGGKVH